MKKQCRFLPLLLALVLLAGCGGQSGYESDSDSFSSCSSEESSSEADSSDSSEAPPSEPDPSGSSEAPSPPLLPDISEPGSPETPVVLASEPPLNEWALKQPIPDFLNEEQQQLFIHAYCAYSAFLSGCPGNITSFPLADGSEPTPNYRHETIDMDGVPVNVIAYETIELDGWEYVVAYGRYCQWEDFQVMMSGLFTPEYKQELIGNTFRSTEDRRLCYLEMGIGSDPSYAGNETDTYELVSQTEDEIRFNLIGHFADWDYEEEVWGEPYTIPYPIHMVHTDRGWRVAEINVPQ